MVLKALCSLLENCHQTESSVLSTRLAKAVLPTVTKMLTSKSKTQEAPSTSKSKSGKKRARNYEGDEVFNVSREVAYPTTEDGEVLLNSIDGGCFANLFCGPFAHITWNCSPAPGIQKPQSVILYEVYRWPGRYIPSSGTS